MAHRRRGEGGKDMDDHRARWIRLIREALERRGMKQVDLADRCEVKEPTVSYWLAKDGGYPEDSRLPLIARALGVPLPDLYHAQGRAKIITVPLDEHMDAETRQLVADYVQLSNQDRGAVRNMVAALHATRQHTPVPLPDHEHTDNGTPRETPECRERETAESRRLL